MFGFGKSPLEKALARVRAGESTYRDEFLGKDFVPRGRGDVMALRDAFAAIELKSEDDAPFGSDLSRLLGVLQDVADAKTARLVRDEVVPVLLRIADDALARQLTVGHDMAMTAKLLAINCTEAALGCIARLVRAYPDEFLWSVVFRVFSEDHPFADGLVAALSSPLPVEFSGVAFLDFANTRALAGKPHVFDTPAATARIEAWLTGDNPKEDSYAHSATVALAFIAEPAASRLLGVALAHRSATVRLEAAWAAAKRGQERGLTLLSEGCREVPSSSMAQRYLDELGHPELIPAACREPEFLALSEMSEWLAHPSELGEPPRSVELAGSWELLWPPTGDRRRLYVIRYETEDKDGQPEFGHGLVGSITFALFGESTRDKRPLEVLALHCCWEAEQHGKFEGKRSVKAGLELLLKSNPELARDLPS